MSLYNNIYSYGSFFYGVNNFDISPPQGILVNAEGKDLLIDYFSDKVLYCGLFSISKINDYGFSDYGSDRYSFIEPIIHSYGYSEYGSDRYSFIELDPPNLNYLILGLPSDSISSLSGFSNNYELGATYNHYERIEIQKYKWLSDDMESSLYLNSPLNFYAANTWNNIAGYFICTSLDNSGKILFYDTFERYGQDINISAEKYLTIYPKIKIY